MIQSEHGKRRFQFRLRDLLLVVLMAGFGLALYVERTHRVVLERKLKSLGTTPRIWVWSPDPYDTFTTEAHVGVVGNVFVPTDFRVTSTTVIELSCWRADEGRFVRFAGPVTTALVSEGPSGNFHFVHNYQRGSSSFPILPPGTYFIEATMLADGKPVSVGFTRLVTVDSRPQNRDRDSVQPYVPQVVEPISPGFWRGEGTGQRP
jgi:hypothetical protein